TDLAKQIARDGEGATKLIEVEVTGAENDTAATCFAAVSFSAPVTSTSINLVAPSPSLAICFAKSVAMCLNKSTNVSHSGCAGVNAVLPACSFAIKSTMSF